MTARWEGKFKSGPLMFIENHKVKALFRKGLVCQKGSSWLVLFFSILQEERPIATLAWRGLPNPPRIPGQVAPPLLGQLVVWSKRQKNLLHAAAALPKSFVMSQLPHKWPPPPRRQVHPQTSLVRALRRTIPDHAEALAVRLAEFIAFVPRSASWLFLLLLAWPWLTAESS